MISRYAAKMDFALISTLIILHQVALYFCKPFTNLTNEENKAIISENYTAIVNLLKDIEEQSENNDKSGRPNFENRKSILHMIQLIHKDGSKAPVAIILTPADLESGGANKTDILNLYQGRQTQEDHENQNKLNKEGVEVNSENKIIHFAKDESQKIVKENLEISSPGNVQQNQRAEDINLETPKADSKSKNLHETSIATTAVENLLFKYPEEEDIHPLTNEKDNNKEDNHRGNDVKRDEVDYTVINTDELQIEDRNLQTEAPLKKTTLLQNVSKETLVSENYDEKTKTIDNQQNSKDFFRKIDLETKSNEPQDPKIYFFDDDVVTAVNSECGKRIKTPTIDKNCKPERRIYNLSFIFNRK